MKKSQQSLKNWTDQDWDYVSKGDKKKPRKKSKFQKKLEELQRKQEQQLKNRKKK